MSFSSPMCSTLIPLYHAWGDEIQATKKLLDVFVKDGTQGAREEVEKTLKAAEQKREKLLEALDEPSVFIRRNGGKYSCIRSEFLAIETIEKMLGEVTSMDSESGRISRLNISNSSLPESVINSAVSLVELFDSLKVFNCEKNPNLSFIPKLPDSLIDFHCSQNPNLIPPLELPRLLITFYCDENKRFLTLPKFPESLRLVGLKRTPAAKDPKFIAYLDEFKREHPGMLVNM